jgi:hypothetical protein
MHCTNLDESRSVRRNREECGSLGAGTGASGPASGGLTSTQPFAFGDGPQDEEREIRMYLLS